MCHRNDNLDRLCERVYVDPANKTKCGLYHGVSSVRMYTSKTFLTMYFLVDASY